MLGLTALAKTPVAATASLYSLSLEPYTFTLSGKSAGFSRGRAIFAEKGSYQFSGGAVGFLTVDNPIRSVTFRFIQANTISILNEERVVRVEPRLRKSN